MKKGTTRRVALSLVLLGFASGALAQSTVDETEPAQANESPVTAESVANVPGTTTVVANPPAPNEAASAGVAVRSSRAKFALVIVGDADASLQDRAAELSRSLHDEGLTGVHDEAIQEALRGGSGDGDGLDPLRRARRTLALSDSAGARADALERIGRASGADALVLLSRRPPTLRVYDLSARSFFEAVPPRPAEARYIASATRAAADRALTAPSLVAERVDSQPEVELNADDEMPPVRAFFRKNWPYMVAGVLLAGAIIWLVAGSSGNDDVPPPVLRFRPGGAEE